MEVAANGGIGRSEIWCVDVLAGFTPGVLHGVAEAYSAAYELGSSLVAPKGPLVSRPKSPNILSSHRSPNLPGSGYGRNRACSTVKTLMDRMVDKGWLEIESLPTGCDGQSPMHAAGIRLKDGRALPTYDRIAPATNAGRPGM